MQRNKYVHEKYFGVLYASMLRRIKQFKELQQIKEISERKKQELIFLDEQREIIKNFIRQEKSTRARLKEGLALQQGDIEGWWRRNIKFRRVKQNCIDRFNNLIAFAKKVEEIIDKDYFEQKDTQTLISEIEDEIKTIIHLSDDYEIKKYGEGILDFCKRNKSPITLAILFIFVSSLAMYTFSNYHIIPKNTQTVQVSFTLDNMHPYDWAQGTHWSYGFHTMLDRIVQHNSYLEGLQYRAYEDQRYGNQDANVLEIHKGASQLLPGSMRASLGENIFMEVVALNKGEVEIKIFQNGNIVIRILFNQDKVSNIGTNSYNFSNTQLEEMYHAIRIGIENRVNYN